MKISILRPVTDGSGTHQPGSEITVPDNEASRLISLGAAIMVFSPVKGPEIVEKKPEPILDEEEYLSAEELAKLTEELMRVSGMTQDVAEKLIEIGIQSLEDLGKAKKADLAILDLDSKLIDRFQRSARALLKK
jgi:predicted flap endonuclease-1-like 5' DNA nuclease